MLTAASGRTLYSDCSQYLNFDQHTQSDRLITHRISHFYTHLSSRSTLVQLLFHCLLVQ